MITGNTPDLFSPFIKHSHNPFVTDDGSSFRFIVSDHVYKSIYSGIDAGVRCMAVQLQSQRRLAPHNVPEVTHNERIGSAAEVGDERAKELRAPADQLCSLQDHLSH